jgi:hypothetical protein
MIKNIDVVRAFKADGYRVTAYDCGKDTVKFCVGVILKEPIDIWYAQSVVNVRNWDLGAPYWNDCNKILYFPSVEIDADVYAELIDG